MKQRLFTLIAILMCSISIADGMNEVYTVFDESTGTLTYYYDDQFEPRNAYHELYDPVNTPQTGRFKGYADKVVKIVIDESMKDANLTSMTLMFCGYFDLDTGQVLYLTNMVEIEGLEHLDTSKVTNMSGMFMRCQSLKSLDLSTFNTAEVKNMNCMFSHCEALESLDLSSFNTANVTDMSYMFQSCSSLTSLDLSTFNTANVTDIVNMFSNCSSLTSLDLSSFDTKNVTNMERMFSRCSSLTILDITNFDVPKVSNTSYMFKSCSALKTIICVNDWSGYSGLTLSATMFQDCNALVGGQGTPHAYPHNDKSYARPDGGTDRPGYFTIVPEIYTNYDESSGTLTYHYDHLRTTRSGVTELYDPIGNPSAVRFTAYYDQVKKAVIDESMKDAGLTSTKRMFYGGYNLGTEAWQYLSAMTEIEGLENLNTESVNNMIEMFYGCESLTSLDLRTFSISNVTGMTSMFNNCKALTTIYCNDDWSYSNAPSNKMFYNCKKLKGGKGTEYVSSYSEENSDNTYARPDGLGGEPGYFSIMGDANGDGKATSADAEAIANYIMGNPPAGFNETLADVNRDGVINIADAVAVVNIISK